MAGFEVEPESIRAGGADLLSSADGFAGQLEAFRAQIASLDGAWGGDTIGMIIGTAYVAVAEWAFECFGAIVEDIGAAGEDLVGMARDFVDTEEAVNTMFDRLSQALG